MCPCYNNCCLTNGEAVRQQNYVGVHSSSHPLLQHYNNSVLKECEYGNSFITHAAFFVSSLLHALYGLVRKWEPYAKSVRKGVCRGFYCELSPFVVTA